MKKLRFLSIALIGLSVALTSCKKDEDKVNAPDSLTGISYLYEAGQVNGVETALEVDFTSATACTFAILAGGVVSNTMVIAGAPVGTGTYTYAKPNVTITIAGERLTGSINGDKLTLKDSDGETFVLVKE